MPRLFTALEIPADIAFSLSLLRGGLPGARWIDPENYHVTLRFIGNVDGLLVDDIADALHQRIKIKVTGGRISAGFGCRCNCRMVPGPPRQSRLTKTRINAGHMRQ